MDHLFTLIKGNFSIYYPDHPKLGPEPDGDTLKFIPDQPEILSKIPRRGDKLPQISKGRINVRLEAVDALEIHYAGAHQNLDFAQKGRDKLLNLAGFGKVDFWDDLPHKVKHVENNPVRGYVLANGIDSHGRLLGFVFDKDSYHKDGEELGLNHTLLEQSFNIQLLRSGLTYPLIYRALTWDLCMIIQQAAKKARMEGLGIWSEDKCHPGSSHFPVTESGIGELNIWPKLFRRLVDFFNKDQKDLVGFTEWLEKNPGKDDLILLPNKETSYLSKLFEVKNDGIKMTHWPEDIVILK